jgi:hypothetical protein
MEVCCGERGILVSDCDNKYASLAGRWCVLRGSLEFTGCAFENTLGGGGMPSLD